jgi:hypothetical protein
MADDVEQAEEKPEDRDDRQLAVLRSHCIQLTEHFDSVQIIVTSYDTGEDRTRKGSYGMGNWYANYGACKEWVQEKEAQLRKAARDDDE